jgi:hypothetical protein
MNDEQLMPRPISNSLLLCFVSVGCAVVRSKGKDYNFWASCIRRTSVGLIMTFVPPFSIDLNFTLKGVLPLS